MGDGMGRNSSLLVGEREHTEYASFLARSPLLHNSENQWNILPPPPLVATTRYNSFSLGPGAPGPGVPADAERRRLGKKNGVPFFSTRSSAWES